MSDVEDPDNPSLTVEDIKEIMSYEPEAEVEKLEVKLDATERQLHTLQSKLTEVEVVVEQLRHFIAERSGDDYELKTIKEVLSWASENVWSSHRWPSDGHWTVYHDSGTDGFNSGITLYQALHSAWSARDTTKDL